MHFGLGGEANAWNTRSVGNWFALVAVSFGLQMLMQLLMSPKARDTWNFPEKERFLQLSPEKQQPVINLMRLFGGICSTCTSLTMLVLQLGMYLAAKGYSKGLPWYINIGLFLPTVVLLIAMIPWSRTVARAVRDASAD